MQFYKISNDFFHFENLDGANAQSLDESVIFMGNLMVLTPVRKPKNKIVHASHDEDANNAVSLDVASESNALNEAKHENPMIHGEYQ